MRFDNAVGLYEVTWDVAMRSNILFDLILLRHAAASYSFQFHFAAPFRSTLFDVIWQCGGTKWHLTR